MTLARMHQNLIMVVRQRVINGEITESRLARMVGISQPHIHNVLKGVRKLSSELADAIMEQLRMNAEELMREDVQVYALPFRPVPLIWGPLGTEMRDFEPRKTSGFAQVPSQLVATLRSPLAARLGEDRRAAPRFETGDLILIDQSVEMRRMIVKQGVYVVVTPEGPRLRYVRQGGNRMYFVSEQALGVPGNWEPVGFTERTLSQIIRGRVVWISRQLDARHEG